MQITVEEDITLQMGAVGQTSGKDIWVRCLVSVMPCAPESPLWGLIPGYGDT